MIIIKKVTSQKSPTLTLETSQQSSHQLTKNPTITANLMSREALLWVPRVTGCTILPTENMSRQKGLILPTMRTQPSSPILPPPIATINNTSTEYRMHTHPTLLMRITMAPKVPQWATTPTSMLHEDTLPQCRSTW